MRVRRRCLIPDRVPRVPTRDFPASRCGGTSALIGASNFFELAVAAAISLFGFASGAARATVVGVLIEVPVMLSVVKLVTATRGWYEQGAVVRRRAAVSHREGEAAARAPGPAELP